MDEVMKILEKKYLKNFSASRIYLLTFTTLVLTFSFALTTFANNIIVSAGYGFAFLNPERKIYRLRDTKGLYDFYHVSLAKEHPIYSQISIVAEPFIVYQARPDDGLDFGFTISGKYYMTKNFYVHVGVGIAYTTYGFKEQGTHLPFILQGGIGYRWKRFFIEDRFKHYSNGGISRPNTSINSNIILIGVCI